MNIFERATRLKLRFETSKGVISVEDLWDLPLTSEKSNPNLDDIAVALNRKLENTSRVSFVNAEQKRDTVSELKFEIIKHIIDVRLKEKKAADDARARAEKRQQLLELISRKENEQLEGATIEELRAELKKVADGMEEEAA